MINVQIVNAKSGRIAEITEFGELVTAPISYSTPYYVLVDVLTALEVVQGKAGQCFVITGLLLASDKNFASTVDSESLTIYEANPADLSTNEKIIVKLDLLRNDRMPVTGLNLLVSEAKSLVAIATSVNVDVTIAGYYVPI